jgi:transcriptional regulator with XRE-family HTH domain
MSNTLLSILDVITAEGKHQGWTQKQICQHAGVSEVAISRARKQGDIRFSTLDKLLQSVGMQVTTIADTPLSNLINEGELFQ